MKSDEAKISLEIKYLSLNHYIAKISLSSQYVNPIFNQVLLYHQKNVRPYGFPEGKAPLEYFRENFKKILLEETKEFLLKYIVINFLYGKLHDKRIITVNQPNLTKIEITPEGNAEYYFEYITPESINNIEEWKYVVFKPPLRKNYRDIDKQVESFIKKEKKALKNHTSSEIASGDWISFDIILYDKHQQEIFNQTPQNFWLKIYSEESESTLSQLFLGRHPQDSFLTSSNGLQEFFSSTNNSSYKFFIKIKDVIPASYFSLSRLKQHFKQKTYKEAYKYLIQVFSYRQDLSQRRETVESLFSLLFSKHYFNVPKYLILRQQEIILDALRNNPDYQVYKIQPDFNSKIKKLAKKQLKEFILIDQIAKIQKIDIDNKDIANYLNLTQRTKTKELIYFELINPYLDIRELLIPTELLKQTVLREKTLNFIINYLLR